MTGVKISTLPWAEAATDTDQLEVNQGGTSRRVTVGQLLADVVLSSGDSASRPLGMSAGFCYFDTTLNKPVWWNGSAWNDATGVAA